MVVQKNVSVQSHCEHHMAPIIGIAHVAYIPKDRVVQKALDKHRGKRKYAASELGISERTLYRKIKEYNLIDL